MIKTFRGLLADGGQDRIRLSTSKGKVGYRIVKFQVFPNTPGNAAVDNVIQIWKISGQSQGTGGGATVDFSDTNLLASAWFSASTANFSSDVVTIFDNELVNQDIYITQTDNDGNDPINYYIELEVIPLTDMGAEYTTIKDLRAVNLNA
jgi:hypothetical protein